MEITGNWRGDNDQISTEKQIPSVNTEGEDVKTIELGYLSCLNDVSFASYILSQCYLHLEFSLAKSFFHRAHYIAVASKSNSFPEN